MTCQPNTSYTTEVVNSRGVAETAADYARVRRGQSWDDVFAELPRNVTPWPDEDTEPAYPALRKDERAKDGER